MQHVPRASIAEVGFYKEAATELLRMLERVIKNVLFQRCRHQWLVGCGQW